jgi:hypothetical protein
VKETKFLQVVRAEYLHGHWVRLGFSDDFRGGVDLSKVLDGLPRKNVDCLSQFTLPGRTRTSGSGADFVPEYLRKLGMSAIPLWSS